MSAVHAEVCNVDHCETVPTVTVRRILPAAGPKLRLWVCEPHGNQLRDVGYDVQIFPKGLTT